MQKTLISLDVLDINDIIESDTNAQQGRKDVSHYADDIKSAGFDKPILIGFADNEKFTALTGIVGKTSFHLAGLPGPIGGPTLAILVLAMGGKLYIPNAIKKQWDGSKAKTVFSRMLKTYSAKNAHAETVESEE
jgi:hypothetical protein